MTTRQTNGRYLALIFAAGLGLTLQAADIAFVGADGSGSGDLSNPNHWAGGNLPTSSEQAVFDKSGTLTAGEAVSFQDAFFWGSDETWTIENAVIKTTYAGASATVGFALGSGGVSVPRARNVLELGAGAKVTTEGPGVCGYCANQPQVGKHGFNTFRIKNGGWMWAKYGFVLGGGNSASNRLEIASGGVLDTTCPQNAFRTTSFGSGSDGNVADISGSFLATNNYEYVNVGEGANARNNVVYCRAGSLFSTKGNLRIGASGSNNRMIVERGATVIQDNASSREVSVGLNAAACSNLLDVASGANVSFKCPLYVGKEGSYNCAQFENPVAVQNTTIGNAVTANNNVYRLYGSGLLNNAVLDNAHFGNGANNAFVIEGLTVTNATANFTMTAGCNDRIVIGAGADLSTKGQISFSIGAGNALVVSNATWRHLVNSHARCYVGAKNTIEIRDNSTVEFTKDAFNFGYMTDGANNTLRVLSGSTLTFSDFRILKDGNKVVISNATVNVQSGIIMPYTNGGGYTAATTNNTFRFEGDSPRLVGAGAIELRENYVNDVLNFGGMEFDFELPEKPYEVAPITARSLTLCGSTRIRASVATQSANRRRYVLAETSTGTIAADLEKLGEELPEGCRLKLSDDKKLLSLSVPGNGGLIMLVR